MMHFDLEHVTLHGRPDVREKVIVRRYAKGRRAWVPFQLVKTTGIYPGKSVQGPLLGRDVPVAANSFPIAAGRQEDEEE